jgi:uncharacterized membrane protein YphA (DoxX/SURF4 family)
MTAITTAPAPATTSGRGRGVNITLWVTQIVLGAFFVVACAGPKLLGEPTTVEMFHQMGAGQWFRYLVGALELAGGIGLLIPRLAGLAALGLTGVMVGATYTELVVLDSYAMAITPAVLGVVFALVAWGRWPRTRALVRSLTRR